MKEIPKNFISEKLIDQVIKNRQPLERVKHTLKKELCFFSENSITNIAIGILIYKEIKTNVPFSFFIYGSSARGKAGFEPKIQELQFWNGKDFLGSAYRKFGNGDLDLRCIADDHKEIFKGLQNLKNNNLTSRINPTTIRINSYNSVIEDLKNKTSPSFFRRVLVLNNPIILEGRNKLTELKKIGEMNLSSEDCIFETQMHEVKKWIQFQLTDQKLIFVPRETLLANFSVFYKPQYLLKENTQRNKSVKITLGSRESSLINISVKRNGDVNRIMQIFYKYPEKPFEDLKKLINFKNG